MRRATKTQLWLSLGLVLLGCSPRPPALHNDPQALAYRSRSPVADAACVRIAAEAVGDTRRLAPWSEGIHVHAADGPIGDGKNKFLFGERRLYLIEYESETGKFREVDARDDATMAYAEAVHTVEQLTRWAAVHGVSWDVQLASLGGRVEAGGPDAAAQKILAELARKAGGPELKGLAGARAALDAKYRDRR